jgi:O-methyltransferase
MSNQSIELNQTLYDYLITNSLREPSILRRLRQETAELEMARMQIAPEQGQLMALLLKLIGARRYLEVGTFTGYSALVSVLAMGPQSSSYALDISVEWTSIAQRYWHEAGVADQINLLLADARDSLASLVATQSDSFDMIFIDADKTGYQTYIESAHSLLRAGGLLLLDNTLWGGAVANPADQDADTVALRAVNSAMHVDERFDISMLPVGDGLTLAMKR